MSIASIEKEKIPRTMSYPLKTSVLESALTSADITFAAELRYIISQGFKGLFDCHFWPANPDVPYERLYIRVSAVPNERAREARDFVDKDVLPAFIAWAQSLQRLPASSPVRREKQHFSRNLPPPVP